jgi:hypothetical protein
MKVVLLTAKHIEGLCTIGRVCNMNVVLMSVTKGPPRCRKRKQVELIK